MVNVFDGDSLVRYAENHLGVTVWVNPHGIYGTVDIHHPEGFVVALPGSERIMGMLYANRIEEFVRSRPLIKDGTHLLGIWLSEGYNGYAEWYLEESVWIERYVDAIRYAKLWDQEYIWDVFNNVQRKVND